MLVCLKLLFLQNMLQGFKNQKHMSSVKSLCTNSYVQRKLGAKRLLIVSATASMRVGA